MSWKLKALLILTLALLIALAPFVAILLAIAYVWTTRQIRKWLYEPKLR